MPTSPVKDLCHCMFFGLRKYILCSQNTPQGQPDQKGGQIRKSPLIFSMAKFCNTKYFAASARPMGVAWYGCIHSLDWNTGMTLGSKLHWSNEDVGHGTTCWGSDVGFFWELKVEGSGTDNTVYLLMDTWHLSNDICISGISHILERALIEQ